MFVWANRCKSKQRVTKPKEKDPGTDGSTSIKSIEEVAGENKATDPVNQAVEPKAEIKIPETISKIIDIIT